MEPPEVLVIHAVAHPNPKVRRVGFALDDPYVEQVWAGVIGPSALLVLRRLPVLWREREPAVVDLRELGRSLGLGPSLARSGRTWKTIERLVGFCMAHWLPGDELGVRTQLAPLSALQLARAPEWTRRVHDRLLGTHLDRLPSPTRTGPPHPPASTTSSTRPDITRGLGPPTEPARTPLQVPLRAPAGLTSPRNPAAPGTRTRRPILEITPRREAAAAAL
jgi:hypothetical protein